MIFIVRHQSGIKASNCLNKEGLYNISQMGKCFSKNPLILSSIYTIKPHSYKHIRPLQTASNLCTMMNDGKSVLVCNTYEDVVRDMINFTSTNDVVIVWHHGEIPEMLRYIQSVYCFPEVTNHFNWPEKNYDGCLIVDVCNKSWSFRSKYFKNIFFLKYFFQNFPCLTC